MKKKMSLKKKLSLFILSILVLFMVGGLFVGNFFYTLAIDRYGDKSMVTSADHNQSESLESQSDWFNSVGYQTLSKQSREGFNLNGYFISNNSHRYAIVVHGYTSQARSMSSYARPFYEDGFNVLLPDLRGHGSSEGHYIGMGWNERFEVIDWANKIIEKDPQAEIILFGVSMGAATVLNASGEVLPPNIKAIVADCGYTSVYDIFSYQLNQLFGLPSFPVMHFSDVVTRLRAGYSIFEASPLNQVRNASVPIFLIHGTEDTFVPYEMVYQLYEAIPSEKEKLIVDGAGHSESAIHYPNYFERVLNFVNRFTLTT